MERKWNWRHVAAIAVLLVLVPQFAKWAAKMENEADRRTASPIAVSASSKGSPEMQVVLSTQAADGLTEDRMDLDFLRAMEKWTIERMEANTNKALAMQGLPAITPNSIVPESGYVYAGGKKLAVMRFKSIGVNSAQILGLISSTEVARIMCVWESDEKVPVSFGPCADKIVEVFGAKIGG